MRLEGNWKLVSSENRRNEKIPDHVDDPSSDAQIGAIMGDRFHGAVSGLQPESVGDTRDGIDAI